MLIMSHRVIWRKFTFSWGSLKSHYLTWFEFCLQFSICPDFNHLSPRLKKSVAITQVCFSIKNIYPGLPWWRSGWESACQCRGHGFEPWSGKIPHAADQLGPWATIAEPARLEPVLRNKRGRDGERPAHHDEEWSPLAATRESPRTEVKTQHSHK